MQQHDRTPLSRKYQGRWREILIGLGVPEKALVNRHGSCPACGGKDRFRFDDKDGLGTFICSQCGAGDGPKLAMLFLACDFREMAGRVRQVVEGCVVVPGAARRSTPAREETPRAKLDRMNALWRRASPVAAGDAAGIYLTSRLGALPEDTGLRFQPRCPYPEGDSWAAMLALYVGPDGRPTALHRTYLGADGRKAPVISSKLSLGPLVDGGAVRLAPVAPVLGIAEGIETALAASMLFGVPCWAALNANRLAVWQPPAEVRQVTIFADADESFTGQTAAFDLQARLEAAGMRVTIETPVDEGMDWNDVLLRANTNGQRRTTAHSNGNII